jgi:hypothetical protein
MDILLNNKRMSLEKIVNGSGSYWGWCKHGQGKSLFKKYYSGHVGAIIKQAKEGLRNAGKDKTTTV